MAKRKFPRNQLDRDYLAAMNEIAENARNDAAEQYPELAPFYECRIHTGKVTVWTVDGKSAVTIKVRQ